jgi:peptidoglycan/LPS O-acetylase OafA/YrhL
MQENENTSKVHFRALDAWRGVCALFVAVFHLPAAWHFEYAPLIRGSYLFVDFFFVLSGFVIAYNYFSRLADAPSKGETISFVIRRFGRLWPLHFAILVVMVAREAAKVYVTHRYGQMGNFAPFTGSSAPDTVVYNILFMHSFGLTSHPSWNGPSWSIGAEFFTYLVFALVCMAGRRRALLLSLAIPVAAATAIALYSPRLINSDYDFGFVRCLYGFFTGVLLQQVFHLRPLKRFRENRSFTLAEFVTLALVVAYIMFAHDNFAMMAAPLVFAAAIYVFAHEKGAVSALLHRAPFQALGKWSYSIYMVHWFVALSVTGVGKAVENRLHIPLSLMENGAPSLYIFNRSLTDLVVPLYLGIIVALASLTYRFIEDPGRRYFNRIAKRVQ